MSNPIPSGGSAAASAVQAPLKILLVTDQFYDANNGMTISSRRFAAVLRAHGHEIRILSYGKPENLDPEHPAYLLNKQYIPVFDNLVASQGMVFAKVDTAILDEAIRWADVVHFLTPFALSHAGILLARKYGVPYTAAFHVQPENVTSSIHLGKVDWVNDCVYNWFRHYVFRYCSHIHCPSEFIAGELRRHGYTAQLHVISNGIDPDFRYQKLPKDPELDGKFVILMVGRLSIEKRQDVLVDAVAKSKYRDRIRLVLAGKGPRKKQIARRGAKRGIDLTIQFFPKPELLRLIAMSDLYVHAADMEIEAMSCMEAFAGGLVPIIANSSKSATPQFALDDRSLFAAGDSADLARKIDYWIEHPQEKEEMEHRYAASAEAYNLDRCVRQAEDMFRMAIAEQQEIAYGA